MTEPTGAPEQVAILECNLDDMTGEALGYALERLLEAGALDVWFTPIYMKKNRPAVMLSALCEVGDSRRIGDCILRETTTLGVRRHLVDRQVAHRVMDEVQTPWGIVRRKLKLFDGRVLAIKPEYEDCARISREQGVPLQVVTEVAREQPYQEDGV